MKVIKALATAEQYCTHIMGPKKKNKETIEQRHVKVHIINSSTMMHTIVTPLRLWLIFKQIFVSRRKSYQLKTPNSSKSSQLTSSLSLSLFLSVSLLIFCKSLSLSLEASELQSSNGFRTQHSSVLKIIELQQHQPSSNSASFHTESCVIHQWVHSSILFILCAFWFD